MLNWTAPFYPLHQWWRDLFLPWPDISTRNMKCITFCIIINQQFNTDFRNLFMHQLTNKNIRTRPFRFHDSELLTCSSGNASDSKDATSTLYFPTVGHLTDSGLQKEHSAWWYAWTYLSKRIQHPYITVMVENYYTGKEAMDTIFH